MLDQYQNGCVPLIKTKLRSCQTPPSAAEPPYRTSHIFPCSPEKNYPLEGKKFSVYENLPPTFSTPFFTKPRPKSTKKQPCSSTCFEDERENVNFFKQIVNHLKSAKENDLLPQILAFYDYRDYLFTEIRRLYRLMAISIHLGIGHDDR